MKKILLIIFLTIAFNAKSMESKKYQEPLKGAGFGFVSGIIIPSTVIISNHGIKNYKKIAEQNKRTLLILPFVSAAYGIWIKNKKHTARNY